MASVDRRVHKGRGKNLRRQRKGARTSNIVNQERQFREPGLTSSLSIKTYVPVHPKAPTIADVWGQDFEDLVLSKMDEAAKEQEEETAPDDDGRQNTQQPSSEALDEEGDLVVLFTDPTGERELVERSGNVWWRPKAPLIGILPASNKSKLELQRSLHRGTEQRRARRRGKPSPDNVHSRGDPLLSLSSRTWSYGTRAVDVTKAARAEVALSATLAAATPPTKATVVTRNNSPRSRSPKSRATVNVVLPSLDTPSPTNKEWGITDSPAPKNFFFTPGEQPLGHQFGRVRWHAATEALEEENCMRRSAHYDHHSFAEYVDAEPLVIPPDHLFAKKPTYTRRRRGAISAASSDTIQNVNVVLNHWNTFHDARRTYGGYPMYKRVLKGSLHPTKSVSRLLDKSTIKKKRSRNNKAG